MKISICIPQYNRIKFLLKSLEIIEEQDYEDIEIVISDDCSSDNTIEEIQKLKEKYRYPIILSRNEPNLGYDRNLRKSMELATGDYFFVIGNDDTLSFKEAISFLVAFLKKNNYPAVGFCNFVEYKDQNRVIKRATTTSVLGNGEKIAIQNYSSFTFVGGLIFKKDWFQKVNTNEFDGSVYVQIYMILRIILEGGNLFTISEPLVLKDIWIDGKFRHSYRDRLQRKRKEFKLLDAGLFSVGHVIGRAFEDSKSGFNIMFYYLRRMYTYTYPHWVLDYKSNNAIIAALGLVAGVFPTRNPLIKKINLFERVIIFLIYCFSTSVSLVMPSFIFVRTKNSIYNLKKRFLK